MDYTQYSFTNLVQRVTQLVQQTDGFGNAYISSTGQMLIQAIASMTDGLNYMLERRTQETYLPTAQLQTSIYALASQFGYRPRRPISANGQVSLQLTNSAGVPIAAQGEVRIPAYTQLTYGGYNFLNTSDIIVVAGQTGPTLNNNIIEGTLVTTTYDPIVVTSTLYTNNYVLIPAYQNIEENSLVVFDAAGNTYNDVTKQIGTIPAIGAISFAKPTDMVYDIRITNRGMMVIFGDGTFGFKPATLVTIQWTTSSGTKVNIVQTGLSFLLPTQTLTDNLNVVPPNLYYYALTNSTGIINALDAETTSHVQQFAPDYIRSADRAVVSSDYELWAKRSGIGGIVDAAVYGQNESGLNPYNMNNVYITYLTETGTPFSLANLNSFIAYMNVYNTLTAHMVIAPATIIPVQVNFRIQRNPQLSMADSQLYDIVNAALLAEFPLAEGSLGETIYQSDIVQHFMGYQTSVNGNMVNIATFVTIDLFCLFPFSVPESLQSITIPLVLGSTGDQYVLNINSHQYLYTQASGDTTSTILATNIAAALNSAPSNTYVTATTSTNSLTITTKTPGTPFTVSNDGSTHVANIPITVTINLPPSILLNPNNNKLFVPGTIQIVNQTTPTTVLATDDTLGDLYNGTVNYVSGVLTIPQPPVGNYYIRYQQNTDQNLLANPTVAFEYSQPKAAFSDSTELFSTITILD